MTYPDCTCCSRRETIAWSVGRLAAAGVPVAVAATPLADGLPDTPAANAAVAYLAAVSSPVMIRHCLRTFLFGRALAAKAGATIDLETLYVASVLHDLGLEARFAGPGDFETIGAHEAARFLGDRGFAALVPAVSAAIELHTLPSTAADPRPEVACLHMGAAVDVTGLRLDQIEPRLIQQIIAEFPREGTKALLRARLGEQIATKPGSRIAGLDAQYRFLERIAEAPFTG